jgi:hypothetical protein
MSTEIETLKEQIATVEAQLADLKAQLLVLEPVSVVVPEGYTAEEWAAIVAAPRVFKNQPFTLPDIPQDQEPAAKPGDAPRPGSGMVP